MRRVIITAALAALSASQVFAEATDLAEDAISPKANQAQQFNVSPGTDFIVEAFVVNVSAGVQISYSEDAESVGVVSASPKGSYVFAGLSDGGSVAPCSTEKVENPAAETPDLTSDTGCPAAAA